MGVTNLHSETILCREHEPSRPNSKTSNHKNRPAFKDQNQRLNHVQLTRLSELSRKRLPKVSPGRSGASKSKGKSKIDVCLTKKGVGEDKIDALLKSEVDRVVGCRVRGDYSDLNAEESPLIDSLVAEDIGKSGEDTTSKRSLDGGNSADYHQD